LYDFVMDTTTQQKVDEIKAEAETQTQAAKEEANAELEDVADDLENQSASDAAEVRQNQEPV
jgi:vacuolar-type H+-ATPase subunit E/Vma4